MYCVFELESNLFCVSTDASFQTFFNFVDMRALVENFCVYHVNAPGQEDGAPTLPEEWVLILSLYEGKLA